MQEIIKLLAEIESAVGIAIFFVILLVFVNVLFLGTLSMQLQKLSKTTKIDRNQNDKNDSGADRMNDNSDNPNVG